MLNKFKTKKSKTRLAIVGAFMFVLMFVVFAAIPSQPVLSDTPIFNAKAEIRGSGITGNLRLRQEAPGFVWIYADIQGDPNVLTPGLHGFHFHETGSCQEDTPTPFSSAGGHFDPGPFGSSTPVEENHPYHLGDLPNIEVDEAGRGRLINVTTRVALTQVPVSLFDDNGSAIIVHQLADQMIAGGTAAEAGGPRLACGVIEPVLD